MCLGGGHNRAHIHGIFTAPNRNPSLIVRRATYEKRAMECCILVETDDDSNRSASRDDPLSPHALPEA